MDVQVIQYEFWFYLVKQNLANSITESMLYKLLNNRSNKKKLKTNLFNTRGVPCTHDLKLLIETVGKLKRNKFLL